MVDYLAAWQLQRDLADARVAGGADTLLLLQHPPVYTAGRRTEPHERPVDGTPVVDTDRGGKITWHGPGQLVGYPIIGLAEPLDVVNYVRRLEESLIKACADLGLDTIRVDGRSVVPPYLQIVQQVRQALRMGVLDVGDQLPTVREVVSATAINPNTVLKAYRDLEREGLVEARAGHGTFVRSRPPGPPPGTHSRLGRSLARWVREARDAGLDDETIEELLRVTLRAADEEEIA